MGVNKNLEISKKCVDNYSQPCYSLIVNLIHQKKGGGRLNCPELRASIARAGVSNRKLSETLGISEQAFYKKIQGSTEFKGSEIKKLANILCLSMADVNNIFFDAMVN